VSTSYAHEKNFSILLHIPTFFPNFAIKYRRYVVNDASQSLIPWVQGGGATLAEQTIASAIYSEHRET